MYVYIYIFMLQKNLMISMVFHNFHITLIINSVSTKYLNVFVIYSLIKNLQNEK